MEGSVAWTEATRAQHGRAHDDRQDDLTDAAGALIAPPVPARGRMGRPRATGPSTGVRCDPVPAVVGVPVATQAALSSAVHFCAWRNDGTLARAQAGRGVDPTGAIIDSPSVKTTESGGPSGSDAGKKIRGRKRHIAGDVEGRPIVPRRRAGSGGLEGVCRWRDQGQQAA